MTVRLSISSFAATARTDVAVGTSSEASMFSTYLAREAAQRAGHVLRPVVLRLLVLRGVVLRGRRPAAAPPASAPPPRGRGPARGRRPPAGAAPAGAAPASRPPPAGRRPAPPRRGRTRRSRRPPARRRTRATRRRRWTGPAGTASRSPGRATRWGRSPSRSTRLAPLPCGCSRWSRVGHPRRDRTRRIRRAPSPGERLHAGVASRAGRRRGPPGAPVTVRRRRPGPAARRHDPRRGVRPTRRSPVRVLLLSPPGAGKGTQGERISKYFGIDHIAAGELLRDHVEQGTELGQKVSEAMGRGELVDDQVVLDMLREPVTRALEGGGYVLDGFPRTVAQAELAAVGGGGPGRGGAGGAVPPGRAGGAGPAVAGTGGDRGAGGRHRARDPPPPGGLRGGDGTGRRVVPGAGGCSCRWTARASRTR